MNFIKMLNSGFESIGKGFASIGEGMSSITLFPKKKYYTLTDKEAFEADAKALRSDWEKICSFK